jgi:hypothetical protein
METVKMQLSAFIRPYRVRLVLVKYEKSYETEPPPHRRKWWWDFLGLFSIHANHVLDREVGLWVPPERRELWLGRLAEPKETIR